jgi:hypothetical protein
MATEPEPQVTAADAAILKMLAGASFGPNASVILPSGRQIDPAEAQALTSAYAPAFGEDEGETR